MKAFSQIQILLQNIIRMGWTLLALPAGVVVSPDAAAQGFSEPSTVFYGKVVDAGGGRPLQLFHGRLEITFVNESNPANAVILKTTLAPTGADGIYSYRLDAPQKYLLQPGEWNEALSIGGAPAMYSIASMRIDGIPAQPLLGSSDVFESSFAQRAAQVRLDLLVSMNLSDADGDGMPDEWELRHGLNPNFANDAVSDRDSDGVQALTEYRKGTDPNQSNENLSVLTQSLLVPSGGKAGFYFILSDSNTPAEDIRLEVTSLISGLTLYLEDDVLSVNTPFHYRKVVNGKMFMEIDPDFTTGTLEMTYRDTQDSQKEVAFKLKIRAFSPATPIGPQPALWFNVDSLSALSDDTPVEAWKDGSEHHRDAFQSADSAQPAKSADQLKFDGSDYLYVDENGFGLSNYTAFLAFDVSTYSDEDATLLSTRDLEIRVGGDDNPLHTHSLQVFETNRRIDGPVIQTGANTQVTLLGAENFSLMSVGGERFFPSHETERGTMPVYSVLGARRAFDDSSASEFLSGSIREILIYDEPLEPGYRARNEDYQLSRWTELLVWDYRDETAPVAITGRQNDRNALNGGWGSDVLRGGDKNDILRGGPGEDQLTGNQGSDRFQFLDPTGRDAITDFDESEGDIVDLTPLLADRRGSPFTYLNLRPEIGRDKDSNAPSVKTVMELNLDGEGQVADKQIVLEGVAYTNMDLPRLVGEGFVQLCGPQFETSVEIGASESTLMETEVSRQVTVRRSGNLDAALDIDLSFTGSADAGVDYQLSGDDVDPMVRRVHFERGEDLALLDLTPIQDAFPESEHIFVSALPRPELTGFPHTPFKLDLEDAPRVTIQTLNPYAERLGRIPGRMELSRTGPVDLPLSVGLQILGTATNGESYESLPSVVTFPAGANVVPLNILPRDIALNEDSPALVQIGVLPDPTRFMTANPWTANVLIVDAMGEEPRNFSTWAKAYFPNDKSIDILSEDSETVPDGLPNILEYVYGTDPLSSTSIQKTAVVAHQSDGFLEVHVNTAAGLSDVRLKLVATDNVFGGSWESIDDEFNLHLEWLSNGQIRRVYRSKLSAVNLQQTMKFFALNVEAQDSIELDSRFEQAIGSATAGYLASRGPVWAPAPDGPGIESPSIKAGETSEFAAFVMGTGTLSFDWKCDLNAADTMSLIVNGTTRETIQGDTDWNTISLSLNDPGPHRIHWRIIRDEAASAPAGKGALRFFQFNAL